MRLIRHIIKCFNPKQTIGLPTASLVTAKHQRSVKKLQNLFQAIAVAKSSFKTVYSVVFSTNNWLSSARLFRTTPSSIDFDIPAEIDRDQYLSNRATHTEGFNMSISTVIVGGFLFWYGLKLYADYCTRYQRDIGLPVYKALYKDQLLPGMIALRAAT